tara:strand:- start:34346 stop:34957 length:612 start_codon:yes stop_codon:yes gene_type:complete
MAKQTFKRASQLSPEERRQQLLRCALGVFARNGLGRGNHAMVAKEAGVAVPTVFSYFPNREALVDAVLEEIEIQLLDIVNHERQRTDLTAYQKLLNLLTNYADFIDQEPDLIKIFLGWNASFEDDLAKKYQAYLKKVITLLIEIVVDGQEKQEFGAEVDPEEAALIVYGSANVIAQIKFSNYDTDITHYLVSLLNSTLRLSEN